MNRQRKAADLTEPAAPGAADNEAMFLASLDRRCRRPLAAYFEKRIREAYDVDDLVQEVFARLAGRSALENIDYIDGYVFQTAANVIRDRLRRQSARRAADHEQLEEAALPADNLSPERALQGRQLLDRAIETLYELRCSSRRPRQQPHAAAWGENGIPQSVARCRVVIHTGMAPVACLAQAKAMKPSYHAVLAGLLRQRTR